jgi:hypothetical protein
MRFRVSARFALMPVEELAKRNLFDLGIIERELLAWTYGDEPGTLAAKQPKYWDYDPDGTVTVFLRNPGL